MLQPVLEWNGLTAGGWDLVSWNCCPAGYVVHSEPLTGLREGDALYGEVSQAAPPGDDDVFTVVSSHAPAGGGPAQRVSLTADMRGVGGWAPTWAEAVAETYFVTGCEQLPCGGAPPMAAFAGMSLVTTASPPPGGVAPIPWSPAYEVDGAPAPAAPICGGAASGGKAGSAVIEFQCA